jgi:hypothetical protein
VAGVQKADTDSCLRTLDSWAEQVRARTTRTAYQFRRRPDDYEKFWSYYHS